MATLSLPGLNIGLLVWLFSTSLVQNIVISPQSSTAPTGQNQPPVDPKVDPLPSSSPSSSLLGESSDASNRVTEKKKKGKEKKKKSVKQGGNHPTSSENPHTKLSKPRHPCII